MVNYQEIAKMLDANAIQNTVVAYEKGRKDAFSEIAYSEYVDDELLKIVYNKALDDVRELTFREVTYTDSLNDRTELRELIEKLKETEK